MGSWVAGLQGCRVTRLQGYKVARLQGGPFKKEKKVPPNFVVLNHKKEGTNVKRQMQR
jgi:hypothetical protein